MEGLRDVTNLGIQFQTALIRTGVQPGSGYQVGRVMWDSQPLDTISTMLRLAYFLPTEFGG